MSQAQEADLPQGGLKIPCTLLFSGEKKEVNKDKLLYAKKIQR